MKIKSYANPNYTNSTKMSMLQILLQNGRGDEVMKLLSWAKLTIREVKKPPFFKLEKR